MNSVLHLLREQRAMFRTIIHHMWLAGLTPLFASSRNQTEEQQLQFLYSKQRFQRWSTMNSQAAP
jgi:hypothetical protein